MNDSNKAAGWNFVRVVEILPIVNAICLLCLIVHIRCGALQLPIVEFSSVWALRDMLG